MASQHDLIRIAAEEDLTKFIKLVAPHRFHGLIHDEVIRWWTRKGAKSHQLLLLPRDHLKSSLLAYRVAHRITIDPAVTIGYISSTSNLAEKQLKFIKDILSSNIYRRYWPDMVNIDEGKRERWSNTEISVDHPTRKREGIRDPTIWTAGLTTSITGIHCNVMAIDDIVARENAYTTDGREKVEAAYSLFASIEQADAEEWAVGTRYHAKDLYGQMIEMVAEYFDEDGNVIEKDPIYEVFQREVEDRGDGTGEFLWPRAQRKDGKWFGFNDRILAKKKAQYLDRGQFNAQYYHNPNNPDDATIKRDRFQYFEQRHIIKDNGRWTYKGRILNLFAAIDFAFSLNTKADYTAIAVIGIDQDHNIYIVELNRFRTNEIETYYKEIVRLHGKWELRKMRAEVTVAQEIIVKDLKRRLREEGVLLTIDENRPTRSEGLKHERIEAILKPRYENQTIYHYQSGITSELEDEVISVKPKHDDLKDAVANAISIATPPMKKQVNRNKPRLVYSNRFGGVQG